METQLLIQDLVNHLSKTLDLNLVLETDPESNVCFANNTELRDAYRISFSAINLLDYIYAVLHFPSYREKYKEFLKIDFPKLPYPKDAETFWKLVKLGGELRNTHSLKVSDPENYNTFFPKAGDNRVILKMTKKRISFEPHGHAKNSKTTNELHQEALTGKIWINDIQYFDQIPKVAWDFYIGEYQPAQKWLADRKGKALTYEDILYYQKLVVALAETDRLIESYG